MYHSTVRPVRAHCCRTARLAPIQSQQAAQQQLNGSRGMQLEPQHSAAAAGSPAPSQPAAPAQQVAGRAQAPPAAAAVQQQAKPAEPPQTDAPVAAAPSAAAGAAAWKPLASAFADEWGLSLEQQQQQPFQPPDPADLRRPAAIIFDIETSGAWAGAAAPGAGGAAGLLCTTLASCALIE